MGLVGGDNKDSNKLSFDERKCNHKKISSLGVNYEKKTHEVLRTKLNVD